MSEIKLLPCPFCGGEAEFVRDTERKDIFQSSDYVYVRCKECHAQTSKIYYSAEFHKLDEEYVLVEKAWNTRKPMQEIVERLEEELVPESDYIKKEDKKLVRHWNNCVDVCKEIVKEVGGIE